MRYYEGQQTYNYSWDKVARAFWCRYPNPKSKHVLSEDVISRYVDEEGRLISKRLLPKTNKAPKWAERFIPVRDRKVMIIEESIVDPKNRTFTTFTRNVGLQRFMTIEEKVTYRESPDNHDWTISERQAWINSNFGYGLSRVVQQFGLERFKANVSKTYDGFQLVLDAMFNPHATYDKEAVKSLHPLLSEAIKDRAKKLSDKAKQKAAPMMAAMTGSEKQ